MTAASTFPTHIKRWQIGVALLLVVAAFALRGTAVLQRAAYDPSFVPTVGRDDYRYWQFTQEFLTGEWPDAPHYFHPGLTYVLGGAAWVFNSTNPVQLGLFVALLDSLTAGALIACGWLLTRSYVGGLLAGGIYALYPVAVFYSTTLLIAPLAAALLSGWLWLTLWQREKLAWWQTLLAGLLVGLLALSRMNLVPIAALYVVWLLALRVGWWRWLAHSLLYSVVAGLLVLPTSYHNFQASGGDLILVATTGAQELYMANNRDSAGRHGQTPAHQALDTDYMTALWRDIQIAPEHFFGLLGYKLAIFASALEPGNNLTFQASADATPMLALLPGNFQWLLVFGLLGLGALWAHDRSAAVLLGGILGWVLLSYLVIFAFGRLRFPAVAPLALLSAVFVVSAWESLRGKPAPLAWGRRYALPALVGVGLVVFSAWVLVDPRRLPPERTYTTLPDDARPLDIAFEDVVLRGWQPLAQWPAAERGWVETSEAFTAELFWEVEQPTERVYQFYMGYFDGGERYAALDRPLGAVSFPETTTDLWRADTIYGEIVSLRFEDEPGLRSGQIRAGVWYWDDEGLIVNVPAATGESGVVLQSLAVYDPLARPSVAEGMQVIDANFENLIDLAGYSHPQTAGAGETIDLQLHWRALANVTRDYTVLVHLDDEAGNLVAQGDNAPVADLFTSNWPPDVDLFGTLPITLPSTAGAYTLYVGLYDATGQRLDVGTPDQRVRLGEIRVQP